MSNQNDSACRATEVKAIRKQIVVYTWTCPNNNCNYKNLTLEHHAKDNVNCDNCGLSVCLINQNIKHK